MADVLAEARRLGLTTSLDTVWDATDRWMKILSPCLQHVDYFLPSLSEAQKLTGRREPKDVAQALRDLGVGTVALKMGPAGSYVLNETVEETIPAFCVPAVDGTGCGDAYVAGFLCGVVRDWETVRCARFANAVGAMCLTALGATAGVRTLEETEAFMAAASPA
jgi:sugar/nucleoside kinase (ribokinase family)